MWPSGSRRASAMRSPRSDASVRSEEHTSELQSHSDLVCRLLLEKKHKRVANELLVRERPVGFSRVEERHPAVNSRADDGDALVAARRRPITLFFFFFNDTATTEIYTLSLHDALPISPGASGQQGPDDGVGEQPATPG